MGGNIGEFRGMISQLLTNVIFCYLFTHLPMNVVFGGLARLCFDVNFIHTEHKR